jgi:cellulose biosynthesis protein BcsQ
MMVVFTNNKGGTGKSTYSTIITQIIANSGLKVAVVDLDHAQMHFGLFMRNLGGDLKIPVYTSLADLKASENNADMVVIDTPPAFSDETLSAIKTADVVVVPINRDKTGILGLQEVASHANRDKIIVVTSQWKMKTRFNVDLYEQLEEFGWKGAINIPENIQIIHNRDANRNWDYGISAKQAEPYLKLAKAILKTSKEKK